MDTRLKWDEHGSYLNGFFYQGLGKMFKTRIGFGFAPVCPNTNMIFPSILSLLSIFFSLLFFP